MPESSHETNDDHIKQYDAYKKGLLSSKYDKNPYSRNFPVCHEAWENGKIVSQERLHGRKYSTVATNTVKEFSKEQAADFISFLNMCIINASSPQDQQDYNEYVQEDKESQRELIECIFRFLEDKGLLTVSKEHIWNSHDYGAVYYAFAKDAERVRNNKGNNNETNNYSNLGA